MDESIAFPHLGIFLGHVGRYIHLGSFTIAYYGICVASGMLLGLFVVLARARATNQHTDDYADMAVWTMLLGIVGARIYYVIFSWEEYRGNPLSIFRIREGGLAIYGGIIAGVLTLYVLCRRKSLRFPKVLDTCVLGLPLAQILGRWGNFFNREAFGSYTDSLFAMRLPVDAVRADEITAAMWEHAVSAGGTRFIQAHPTFLYEGIWNTGVFLLLFLLRNKTTFDGELFLVYIAAYGTGRFFIETLRTDQLLIPGTSFPASMAVSALAVAAAVVAMIVKHKRRRT